MFDKNEPSDWIKQNLYSYNCKTYGSYSIFNLSILQNVKVLDSTSIFNKRIDKSAFFLNMSIRSSADNRCKTYNLKYADIVDLYMSLNNASKDPDMYKNKTIITKRNSTKILEFEFLYSDNFNENLITITIRESENDFVYIIIPQMEFICFYSMIKEFKAAYVAKSIESVNETVSDTIMINEFNDLKSEFRELKKIMYNIKDNLSDVDKSKKTILHEDDDLEIKNENSFDNYINENVETEISVDSEVIEINNEFENFTLENIDTVVIPGIEAVERSYENEIKDIKPKDEYIDNSESDLFTILLNNDLKTMNNFNEIIYNSSNCFSKMNDILENKLNLKIYYNRFKSNDVKSHFYMSKFSIDVFMKDWELNNNQIPLNFPVMRFNTNDLEIKNTDDKSISLIYDLIFINIYIKCMRNKLSQKTGDQYSNYAFMNLKTRLFTDPLILLYQPFININTLKNIIIERYKKYSIKGYLIACLNDLSLNNCSEINSIDISNAYDEYIKCFEVKHFIKDIHDKGFANSNFKIPYTNIFSFEQILNECIPCEIANHFKTDDIKNITENVEILNLFEPKKSVKQRVIGLYSSHLNRFICEADYIKEIPENIITNFTEYVKTIEHSSFDLNKYSLLELGDNIVKAIYVWNNTSDDERGKGNYTAFRYKVDECMSKDLILSSIKSNELNKYNEIDTVDDTWAQSIVAHESQVNNFTELVF